MVFTLAAETLDYRSLWLDQEQPTCRRIMVKAFSEVMRAAHLQEGPEGIKGLVNLATLGELSFLVSRDNQQMISWVNKRLTQGMYQKSSLVVKEKLVAKAASICKICGSTNP